MSYRDVSIAIGLHLTRQSPTEKILTDHKRTVNSLSWSPFTGNYLLSGSTDSTIKLWDLRDTTKHVTFATAKSGTDSVREVQFSPINANQFASALDSGTIQVSILSLCDGRTAP